MGNRAHPALFFKIRLTYQNGEFSTIMPGGIVT